MVVGRYFPASRLAGLGGLVLLIPLAATLNRLALATAAALVVVVLAAATPLTSGDDAT
jgi:hypothetical protein